MQVQSLSWDDPLEKEMATHSSILAWEVPTHGGVWQATLHGVIRVGHDLATKLPQVMETTQTHTLCHVFACIHTHIYTLKKNHIYHIIHYTHTHTHTHTHTTHCLLKACFKMICQYCSIFDLCQVASGGGGVERWHSKLRNELVEGHHEQKGPWDFAKHVKVSTSGIEKRNL